MKRLIPKLLPGALGLALALWVAKSRGGMGRIPLSDGFFVAGLLETGLGLLLCIAQTGFFDIFAYAAHGLLVLFTPFRRPEDLPDYPTFSALRSARQRKPFAALLVTGLVLLGLSAALLL